MRILKKISFVLILIIGCFSLLGCGGAGAGIDRPVLKVHVRSDLLLPIGIPNADHKLSDVELSCEVIDTNSQGDTTIRLTLVSVKASVNTLGKIFKYDSEGSEVAVEKKKKGAKGRLGHQEKFTKAFSGLAGKSYTASVNSDGNTRLLEIEEPLRKLAKERFGNVSGNWGYDQTLLVFSARHLRDYASLAVLAGKGDSRLVDGSKWTNDTSIQVPRTKVVAFSRKYHYDGVEKQEDGNTVKIVTYEIVWNKDGKILGAKRPAAKSKSSLKVLAAEGRGKLTYTQDNIPMKLKDTTIVEVHTGQGTARKKNDSKRRKIYYRVIRTIDVSGR